MTAIQAAEHEQFCKAIETLMLCYKEVALSAEKDTIEKLYSDYRGKISEIQKLITEYKKMQVQTRKKMAGYQRNLHRPVKKPKRETQ